jgi:hypothetical protein
MSLTDILSSPDYRSTKGRTPVFRPTLNGEEFPMTVTQAQFSLGHNQHDVAILTCTSSTLTTTDGMVGSAITFLWGQAPRTEVFAGYIVTASVDQAGQGSFTFTLTVMGPTKVMQEGQPRFWSSRTYPGIAAELSYTNKLGFRSMDQPYVWESSAQTDESDWQVVTGMAEKTGWCVYNRYGVVMYMNPTRMFQEMGAYAVLRSSDDRDFQAADDRRLIEFNPNEESDDLPNQYGRKVAYFTTTGSVQVAEEPGNFLGRIFVTGYPIRNSEEASILTTAGSAAVTRWKQTADARIWGDSDIYPGHLVDVITTNRTYVRNKFDGRWLVWKVDHSMDTNTFQTNLSLVRPASTTPISQTAYRQFWNEDGRARPTLFLRDGKWWSSWTTTTIGAVA